MDWQTTVFERLHMTIFVCYILGTSVLKYKVLTTSGLSRIIRYSGFQPQLYISAF
jgi:hypothetical protein